MLTRRNVSFQENNILAHETGDWRGGAPAMTKNGSYSQNYDRKSIFTARVLDIPTSG